MVVILVFLSMKSRLLPKSDGIFRLFNVNASALADYLFSKLSLFTFPLGKGRSATNTSTLRKKAKPESEQCILEHVVKLYHERLEVKLAILIQIILEHN